MKFLTAIRSFYELLLFEHMTLPIRMAAVFMVIRSFYIDNYNIKSELGLAATYLFGFFLLYVLTIVLNVKRADSSPFYLSEFIEKQVIEDYEMRDILTLDDQRGVFVRGMHVEGHNVITTFRLHDNPEYIKGKAIAYSNILSSMQLPSQEKLVKRLDKIIDEAWFMLSEVKSGH